jgi:integrase
MNTNFVSTFAERLVNFLEQKQALGYHYNGAVSDFRIFDRMCAEHFPNETTLTADICNAWATRRGNESSKTTARRLPFIREFARYLIRSGEQAYILPTGTIKQGQRYIPHIYSRTEVAAIWQAFDNICPTKTYPTQHIVVPTLVRLLYCCGLRPSETINLKPDDVSIHSGKLYIAESKGNRDRIVMLSDDVRELLRNYNELICEYIPNRNFFFAKNTTDPYDPRWINLIFRKIRDELRIETRNGNPPRLYDFRHTFATHRLYQWMRDGKDLYAMMPYLSAYMGHTKITETFYYIHLVPGMLETMSGFKYESAADIFPQAVETDE